MQDLSGITSGLAAGASMHGGNTVSERPAFAAPGSASEGTANAGTSDHPDMDLGETWTPSNRIDGGGSDSASWSDVPGITPGPDTDAHA